MKKTKKQNFVARILQPIRNIYRIVRLLCKKKHKKAGKIVKNETIKTVKITHDKLLFFLEYTIPAIIIGIIIMGSLYIADILGLGFSSEKEIHWFIIIFSIAMFIFLYELVKCGVRYFIDKFIPKEWLMYVFVCQFFWIEKLIDIGNMNFVRNISFGL